MTLVGPGTWEAARAAADCALTAAGYRKAGGLLGGLGVPTVVVQEGGYDLERIGPLVRETLLGPEEDRP